MQGKIYVVFVGREPDVYDTWREALSNVNGHKGDALQSFRNREEAEIAYHAYLVKQSTRMQSPSAISSSRTSFNTREKVSPTEKVKKLQEIDQNLDEKKKIWN